ncbi:type I restriction enzyme HsdR N-terminal domain-containing protein [Desulfonatronum thioautotrophicum]|uniref:type I restriction enzyme HsdR N-terminal domain-containing protein n=1 Tax=Desulfonatronum thioautotrophicum TaxID=617001 RepID=UPI0005EBE676|nr:type I restriction enzyme HsdR N-terminal domain-containing protein [Desulfonatronum thioautotrophicum]
MHEVSLGQTINDYLTGESLEMTTYEDLRQALARLLVEEKGYPHRNLYPKVPITYDIDGKPFSRCVDLLARNDQGTPLLALLFCSGTPETYTREAVYAGRLLPEGPAPLVVVTDSKDARLLRTLDGKELATGFTSIPSWEELQHLIQDHPTPTLDPNRLVREQRVFYMYSGFLEGCCGKTCPTS